MPARATRHTMMMAPGKPAPAPELAVWTAANQQNMPGQFLNLLRP